MYCCRTGNERSSIAVKGPGIAPRSRMILRVVLRFAVEEIADFVCHFLFSPIIRHSLAGVAESKPRPR